MPVSSGLYNFLTQNPAAAGVQALLSTLPPINGVAQFPVYISRADKQPPVSYIVIHTVDAPPAAHSLNGPSGLSDGEFQFDSCGPDQLTAQALSLAVKNALEYLGGALSDGTTIQFYEVALDADEPYEVGGGSYVFRRCLRLRAFYTEAGYQSFNFDLGSGLTGSVEGMAVSASGIAFTVGQLTSGNQATAATFASGSANPQFQTGSFSGNWVGSIIWEQIGAPGTYVLMGAVASAGGSPIPVTITFYNVVFAGGGWSN